MAAAVSIASSSLSLSFSIRYSCSPSLTDGEEKEGGKSDSERLPFYAALKNWEREREREKRKRVWHFVAPLLSLQKESVKGREVRRLFYGWCRQSNKAFYFMVAVATSKRDLKRASASLPEAT
jgi:hypothetical protein